MSEVKGLREAVDSLMSAHHLAIGPVVEQGSGKACEVGQRAVGTQEGGCEAGHGTEIASSSPCI